MIQLSTLGQNRLPAPSIHYHQHDLNDRKQLELMERTGYEIVQRNGQRIYGGKIMIINLNLKVMHTLYNVILRIAMVIIKI